MSETSTKSDAPALVTSITYFDEPGPQNTDATLALALERARALDIRHGVVATDTGKTARAVLDRFHPELDVIAVTNPRGIQLPISKLHDYLPRFARFKQSLVDRGVTRVPVSLSDQTVVELAEAGAHVTRMDWRKFQAFTRSGLNPVDRIGVGVRVGLTIAIWAHLDGALPADVCCVALAGTGFGGGGADTAIVVQTAATYRDWRVLEILCRPRVSPPSER